MNSSNEYMEIEPINLDLAEKGSYLVFQKLLEGKVGESIDLLGENIFEKTNLQTYKK